jgi:hypothetical protein
MDIRCKTCGARNGLDFDKPDIVVSADLQKVMVTGFCDNCGDAIILTYVLKGLECEHV